jgi:hypothetical protein
MTGVFWTFHVNGIIPHVSFVSGFFYLARFPAPSILLQVLHSFLWPINIPHFIHSSAEKHLNYFHLLTTRNATAMDIVYKVLIDHLSSIIWGRYLGVELWGHMVVLCVTY